jgi:hypothetical protein
MYVCHSRQASSNMCRAVQWHMACHCACIKFIHARVSKVMCKMSGVPGVDNRT